MLRHSSKSVIHAVENKSLFLTTMSDIGFITLAQDTSWIIP